MLEKLLTLAPQTPPPKLPSPSQITQAQATPQPTTTQYQPTAQQQPITTEVITQDTPTIPTAIAEKHVTFHNDVNSVSLGKLGTLEANLLFVIFHKLKDKEDELLVFDCDEIKTMVHAVKISKSELSSVVKRLEKH
ncbi:hypothetical protein HHE02_02000 [Helicobacter heilmannii]|uniref:RepB family plasmid replication initiator protein n=1 Tax=Helicobacter heilmannii TaxID=35817 RepID=UPI0006A1E11E|nr:RepB family plasmid replication initiator protein [Helicobacter heilmannii]CRF46918.1 hypothetical protein HHE02_02000 [Helicobacter heilmannii]